MITPILILLVLVLAQSGCSVFGDYTDEIYRPLPPSSRRDKKLND